MTDKHTSQLPPWKCLNRRDADKLIEWTNARLDEQHAISEMFIQTGELTLANRYIRLDGPDDDALLPTFEWAREVYRDSGDLTLMQQADPDYAKYLLCRRPRQAAKIKRRRQGLGGRVGCQADQANLEKNFRQILSPAR